MAAESNSDNDDIVRKLLEEQSARYHEELRRRGGESAVEAIPAARDTASNDDDDSILKLCAVPMTRNEQEQEEMTSGRELEQPEKLESISKGSVVHPKSEGAGMLINRLESVPGAHRVIPNTSSEPLPPPPPPLPSPPLPPVRDDLTHDDDESQGISHHSRRSCLSTLSETRNTHPSSSDMSSGSDLVAASLVDVDDEENLNPRSMPQADPVDTLTLKRRQRESRKRTNLILILGLILVMIIAASLLAVILVVLRDDTGVDDRMPHLQYNDIDNEGSPEDRVLSLLPTETLHAITVDPESPQAMAFQWLMQDPLILSGRTYDDTRILQRFTLATIYFSTDGDNWKNNDRWLSFDHHECDWEFTNSVFFEIPALTIGLATKSPCSSADSNDDDDDDDDVSVYTDLRLSRNGLNGKIPKELELLTSLKSMDISFNDELIGTLPHKAFERLSNLEAFVAVSNRHTGHIPPFLFQQTSMSALVLYDNNFSGSIPSSVGDLSSLKLLALGDNSLTGSLPSQVGRLSNNLVTLNVERNTMNGTIPTELGLLSTSLTDLYLRGNKEITGFLPTELGQLAAVKFVSLGECGLSGTVPSQLGQLGDVVKLYLQNNTLVGSIPSHLGQLTAMRRLKLQDNNLSGSIPSELASLRSPHYSLEYLSIRGNDLISGEIPNELCKMDGQFDGEYDCSALLCGCECLCV